MEGLMKIEIEITPEVEDEVIVESLRTHLGYQSDDSITYDKDPEKQKKLVKAFKIILDYYGGT